MKKVLSVFLLLAFIFLMVCVSGCERKKQKFTDYSFDSFDTATSIIGFETTQEKFNENAKIIKQKLYEYHKLYTIYSRYDSFNNLNTVNSLNDGAHKPIKVDKKIIDMLKFSKEMYTLTNGRMNIAMGSVLSIWHDCRQAGIKNPADAYLPEMCELKEAVEHTDISNLIIDEEENTVFLKDPKMTLDVGAVAKGYATEQTALYMEQNGITGYLLNVGGNIRVVGDRPDGKKWEIGIENPDVTDESSPYIEYITLEKNTSIVTSGSYQRFYIVDGKSYHHIIDPDTLMPSTGFKLISVINKSSAVADVLSTALFTMDFESGKALIDSLPDTEALWVTESGKKLYSEGFIKEKTND